ncbi:MAG: DUF5666 domain-containing protein [Thermoanaerobaculia bacterium]
MNGKRAVSGHRSVIVAVAVLLAVSSFGQTSSTWRTAAEVDTGETGTILGTVVRIDGSGFDVVPDEDSTGPALRVAATSSTRYVGLGVDAETSLMGTAGLQQLRTGDRVRVRGTAQAPSVLRADEVQLLGRDITPPGTAVTVDAERLFEGEIVEIRLLDQSFILESDDGDRTTIVATRDTPVIFEGETYTLRNLEVGDRVQVEMDVRLASGEIRARRIEVLQDVTPEEIGGIRSRNFVTGRVTEIDVDSNRFTLRADRIGELRIEARRAVDASGDPFRVATLQVGDRLRIRGEYASPTTFRAERIEYGSAEDVYEDDEFLDRGQEEFEGYSTVVFFGTVHENLENEDLLTIRDRDGDRRIDIVVDEEFVVQSDDGFVRARQLRRGDDVVIKAFRGREGDYIAQTIRLQ